MLQEDLMIGDWVKHLCKVFRVKAIDGNHIYMEDSNGEKEDQHIERLEPIPITPSILEKNGFECNQFRSRFIIDDNHILEFDKLERQLILWEEKSVLKSSIFIARINYIHELQHALRLCGINKEIEL